MRVCRFRIDPRARDGRAGCSGALLRNCLIPIPPIGTVEWSGSRDSPRMLPESPQPNSGLLQRAQSIMGLRRYSQRTQSAYLHWIVRFVRYHDRRHPRGLGEADVLAATSWSWQ
jgi:hypothetical protein